MQLDLPLHKPLHRTETQDVSRLITFLMDAGDWRTARDLTAAFAWSDRQIRALAEAADGWIISGQKGYKHVQHATPEEIHHATSWMESQAKKMAERAAAIRRHAHQIIH